MKASEEVRRENLPRMDENDRLKQIERPVTPDQISTNIIHVQRGAYSTVRTSVLRNRVSVGYSRKYLSPRIDEKTCKLEHIPQ